MAQGSINKLVRDRGFGFILPEGEQDASKNLFFHRSNVDGAGFEALQEGEPVSYEIGRDERRGNDQAVHVQSAGAA